MHINLVDEGRGSDPVVHSSVCVSRICRTFDLIGVRAKRGRRSTQEYSKSILCQFLVRPVCITGVLVKGIFA